MNEFFPPLFFQLWMFFAIAEPCTFTVVSRGVLDVVLIISGECIVRGVGVHCPRCRGPAADAYCPRCRCPSSKQPRR